MSEEKPDVHDDLLFLEDLTVGRRFRSREEQVSADDIIAFARRFDPQPFHTDAIAAQSTFFAGLAASGWHVAAITMRLLVESVPIAGGIIGAGGQVAWPTATRPGDLLHVEAVVADVAPSRSRPDRGMVTIEGQTLNQDGEVRERMQATLVCFARPASD